VGRLPPVVHTVLRFETMHTTILTRRSVLLGGVSTLGIWKAGLNPFTTFSDSSTQTWTETQRRSLAEILKNSDSQYDPNAKMIASPVSLVGYHTTIKEGTVHPTRTSLEYAVALLDSGEEERLQRARDILDTVIALQDRDPFHATHGIWSWYLEEPLDKMSPPDWNWADFCGVQLLAAWIDHRERLGDELAKKTQEAILLAAKSIQRRNVGFSYTNIAIMGMYVTLVAGNRFGQDELYQYAQDRLNNYHKYILERKSFSEYNSPTYTIVAIQELSRMLAHIHEEAIRTKILEIHDIAWQHAACRFHSPTRQWAGPHSRSYSTLLRQETVHLLEYATGEKKLVTQEKPISLALSSYRLALHCPDSYLNYFSPIQEPRTITEVFTQSSNPNLPTIGTTYLHPDYTLGTINHGDFWNQRRPLVAYWGTPDQPAYLQVRFLHDGYDFCSAIPITIQEKGRALTAVVFATDHGDTHPSLDRIANATIRAKDFRLRFEFGGSIDNLLFVPFNGEKGMIVVTDRSIQIQIRPIADPFGSQRCSWEIGENQKAKWIDAVAYSGEEKAIDLSQIEKFYLAFAFQIYAQSEEPVLMNDIHHTDENNRIQLVWKIPKEDRSSGTDYRYRIAFPGKPTKFSELLNAFQLQCSK